MLFNSYIFIFAFLPVVLLGYYAINRFKQIKIAQTWLVVSSLLFYGYFNYAYLVLIVFSIVFNFSINKVFHISTSSFLRKAVLVFAISVNLGIFMYYKYYDFFIDNINTIFNTSYAFKNLLLPLGISFFTFQQVSYIIDSYRKEVEDYSFIYYASFVAFFPQLIAGPIVLHNEIIPQFLDKKLKKFNYDNFSKGIFAFTVGLAKKILIADVFGNAVAQGYSTIGAQNTTTLLLVMVAYTFQIYFDFSGYCDMATGLGLMFNINITQNFNSPYKAVTIIDFWQRWHMTLTRFFKRYLYIPLGGNRKGIASTLVNMMIVFVVSGFWHGASWTFIIWGALHGIAVIFNKLLDKKIKKLPRVLNWCATFIFVNLTWVFFRAPSIQRAGLYFSRLIALDFGPIDSVVKSSFLPEMVKGVVGLFPVISAKGMQMLNTAFVLGYVVFALMIVLFTKNTYEQTKAFKPKILTSITITIIFVWSIVSLTGVNIFLYFNF